MRVHKPVKLKLAMKCSACDHAWRIETDVKEGSPEQQKVVCPKCGKLAVPASGGRMP